MNRFALFLAAVGGAALAAAAFWPLLRAPAPVPEPVPFPAEPRAVAAPGPRWPVETLPPYQASPSRSRAAAFDLLRRGHQRLGEGDWWGAVADHV